MTKYGVLYTLILSRETILRIYLRITPQSPELTGIGMGHDHMF